VTQHRCSRCGSAGASPSCSVRCRRYRYGAERRAVVPRGWGTLVLRRHTPWLSHRHPSACVLPCHATGCRARHSLECLCPSWRLRRAHGEAGPSAGYESSLDRAAQLEVLRPALLRTRIRTHAHFARDAVRAYSALTRCVTKNGSTSPKGSPLAAKRPTSTSGSPSSSASLAAKN
jgi:hypothetical protein